MLTLNFVLCDQISQFINCYAPHWKLSKIEIKLSTKPWITKDILAYIRYRDKQLHPNLISLHKNSGTVVKDIKASKSNTIRSTFCVTVTGIIFKKSDVELDQS